MGEEVLELRPVSSGVRISVFLAWARIVPTRQILDDSSASEISDDSEPWSDHESESDRGSREEPEPVPWEQTFPERLAEQWDRVHARPFFQDVPAELYEKIIDETTTQSYVPGCYLFREGDEAARVRKTVEMTFMDGESHRVHGNTHVATVTREVITSKWGAGALYKLVCGERLLQGNERCSTLQQGITII
eukprot:s10012_g1.t1